MTNLSDIERAVLEQYRVEDEADSEGAFAPYYHTITQAAGGDPDTAYAVCKRLKTKGLLTSGGARAGRSLLTAPSYWITDEGKEALA